MATESIQNVEDGAVVADKGSLEDKTKRVDDILGQIHALAHELMVIPINTPNKSKIFALCHDIDDRFSHLRTPHVNA